jgi:hypothetical protein
MTAKPKSQLNRSNEIHPFAQFSLQPRADQKQETRRDWVRAAYLGRSYPVFVGVIAFASYANPFGDWTKAKDLLALILPALTGLVGAGTAFYFKNSNN